MGALSKEDQLRASIHRRALQIRTRRCYIGVWEWIAWGCLNKTLVLILFGENLVDVFEAPHAPWQTCKTKRKGMDGERVR